MVTDLEVSNLFKQHDRFHERNDSTFLCQYVRWCEQQTTAPTVYHLGNGLNLLSMLCPSSIYMYYAGKVNCNLFTMVVGRSGDDMKSTSLGLTRKVLKQYWDNLIAPHPASAEGLIDHLSNFPTQMFIYSEMGKFLSLTGQGYAETIKTTYTDLWDCEPQSRAKAGGDLIQVEHPYVNILSACSLPYLERYTKPQDWNGGFLGRFLIFLGRSHRVNPNPKGYRLEMVKTLGEYLRQLNSKSSRSSCIGLTPEAEEWWNDWYFAHAEKILPTKIAGTKLRLPAMIRKIALLLAFDDGRAYNKEFFKVNTEDLQIATAIGDMHLKSISTISELLCDSDDERLRKRIIQTVEHLSNYGKRPVSKALLLRTLKIRWSRIQDWIGSLKMEGTLIESERGFIINTNFNGEHNGTETTP